MGLTARGLEQSERALEQRRKEAGIAEQQGKIGLGVQALGTGATAALAAKQLGLIGGASAAPQLAVPAASPYAAGFGSISPQLSATTGFSPAATTPLATTGGGVGIHAGTGAGIGGPGVQAGATGGGAAAGGTATTTPFLETATGTALSYAAPAAGGFLAGRAFGPTRTGERIGESMLFGRGGQKEHEAAGGFLAGAATGAAIGSFIPGIGTVIGGVIGGVVGGASGFLEDVCIIITAATDKHSSEVEIAREYRDNFMPPAMQRGYYMIAEQVVPLMRASKEYKDAVKKHFVDKVTEYCSYVLGYIKDCDPTSIAITETFLAECLSLGLSTPLYVRSSGEIV
jgi:hypothetical protein